MPIHLDLPRSIRRTNAGRAVRPGHKSRRTLAAGLVGTLVLVAILGLGTVAIAPAAAQSTTDSDEAFDWDDAWQEAEERAREEQRQLEKARQVNEGELVFLTATPDPDGARMEKRILLDRQSLETGWAEMRQCHDNLDPAPAVQIVYNDERTREIRITQRDGVGMARVDGPSVQMREIERGARICVSARVLAIVPHPTGEGYLVENGPFMRRFLDGYYPMQVRLRVDWPTGWLELAGSEPAAQPGLAIEADRNGVTLEAHFEGRLISRLHLSPGPALPTAPR